MRACSCKCRTGDAGEFCEARRHRRPSCGGIRKTNARAHGRCCTTDNQKTFRRVETDKRGQLWRVCPVRRRNRTETAGGSTVGAILPQVSGGARAAVKTWSGNETGSDCNTVAFCVSTGDGERRWHKLAGLAEDLLCTAWGKTKIVDM